MNHFWVVCTVIRKEKIFKKNRLESWPYLSKTFWLTVKTKHHIDVDFLSSNDSFLYAIGSSLILDSALEISINMKIHPSIHQSINPFRNCMHFYIVILASVRWHLISCISFSCLFGIELKLSVWCYLPFVDVATSNGSLLSRLLSLLVEELFCLVATYKREERQSQIHDIVLKIFVSIRLCWKCAFLKLYLPIFSSVPFDSLILVSGRCRLITENKIHMFGTKPSVSYMISAILVKKWSWLVLSETLITLIITNQSILLLFVIIGLRFKPN